jgi:hypothetical protein
MNGIRKAERTWRRLLAVEVVIIILLLLAISSLG